MQSMSNQLYNMKALRIICLIVILLQIDSTKAQNIVINELVTSNSAINVDEDGSYEDWIELYNPTAQPIDLNGFGLSDNPGDLFKWVFPSLIMAPGDYLLVWCSDKNRNNPALPLHTNFKLSASGETITLTQASGQISDQLNPVIIPANFSYGRKNGASGEFTFFQQPTPGAANSTTGYTEILPPPVFSANSGFFQNPFELTLTSANAQTSIIYTMDGSEPSLDNLNGKTYIYKNSYPEFPFTDNGELLESSIRTIAYEQPIQITDRSLAPNKIASISTTFNQNPYYIPVNPIFKGTIIRAKAIRQGAFPSDTKTCTYFISHTTDRYSLPIVSISVNENDMFDYEDGIYVAGKDFDDWRMQNPGGDNMFCEANYKRDGDETEKKANFSYFKNGSEVINQNMGIRLSGRFSRIFPSKSMVLYARSEYGKDSFEYPFFPNSSYDSFKRLLLRNSGNDFQSTYFRDAFAQRIVAHMNLATQDYQPTVTFLNGEYWGLLNLQERYDKYYFERVYDIDEDALDFLEYNGYIIQEGDNLHYVNMLNYIQNNNFQDASAYEYIRTQMDTENFTDFFIANIYARNTDWPHNNIEFWRKKMAQYEPNAPYGQDGRWRWVLKDTDFGFGLMGGNESYTHDTLAFASSTGGDELYNPEWSTLIFRKLLENNTFKTDFINRFADMMNTTFKYERVSGILEEMKQGIQSEIAEHGSRWQSFTLAQWNANVQVIDNFAEKRAEFQRNHIRQKFGIEQNVDVALDVSDENAGYIKINTIEILETTPGINPSPYPWQGIYFKGIPIKLTAFPKSGFVFSHWSGSVNSTESEISVVPDGNIQVTAHFIPVAVIPSAMPIYFWNIDNSVANDTPLTEINSSFEILTNGKLTYNSCLEGYPFNSSHPYWRKASMERRNSPTLINYIPEANYNIPFESSNMRGIQIKQPFENNGSQNQMIFEYSTAAYENMIFGFAAKNENAAESIIIDYSVADTTEWITTGLALSTYSLSSEFQLFEINFSSITAADNNPNFKVRLRFGGSNMTADGGNRVTFNNFSLKGNPIPLATIGVEKPRFEVFPNPVVNELNIIHDEESLEYSIFTIDGKLIKNEMLKGSKIDAAYLKPGIYILKLNSGQQTEIKKIVKE